MIARVLAMVGAGFEAYAGDEVLMVQEGATSATWVKYEEIPRADWPKWDGPLGLAGGFDPVQIKGGQVKTRHPCEAGPFATLLRVQTFGVAP